jgi:putative nucleotidyltransferase with HDIG domain
MKTKQSQLQLDITGRIPFKELSTLLKVSSSLATSLDLNIVLQTAIESTCEILEVDTGAIYEFMDEKLFLGATTPPLPPEMEWLRLQPESLADHPHIQNAFQTRKPIFIVDAQKENLSPAEAAVRDARHLQTILYIPIMLEEKAIGVLIVGTNQEVRNFSDAEVDLCRVLSYQVSLSLTNARLFRTVQQSNLELNQAYDATLLGWSLALDLRDQLTQGHTKRVVHKTIEVCKELGIPDEKLINIRRGALLHDIGKMGIPDSILKKPGPLSDEEWVIMRKHPEYAYDFLKQINYLQPALEIPYCHHEKWDGSGYPRGLRGEEIPLSARVFAVVDVYDALISDRPYRAAWQKEVVYSYILEQTGKHFDPKVVEAFLRIENNKTL